MNKFPFKLSISKSVLIGLIASALLPFQMTASYSTSGTIWTGGGGLTQTFTSVENISDTTTVVVSDSTTAAGATGFAIGGTDAVSFILDAVTGDVYFLTSPDYETKSSYTYDLGATDGSVWETATITVTITDTLWNDITQTFTSVENISDTTTVVVSDSTTAIGATGFALGGTDAASFTLDAVSGNVYFLTAPDYENKSSYTFDLGATDGTVWETATITVSVTNDTSDDPASAPAPAPVYIPTTPQAALTLTSSATTVEWGTQAKLNISGGSGTGAVTYSSTGTTFCAVDRNGYVTPVSAGTCTVIANKDGDGTYGSAQSNSITITATDKPVAATTSGSASNSGVSMVVGKPVGGVATVKFTVADTYAGEKVSVILATKSSAGKTIYKTLGSAKVGSTGAVTFKTKVKLSVGAVLQLKSAGSVILSKSIQ